MRERSRPIARLTALLAAAACVAALGSCKDSLPPPIVITDGIAGHYILRTIDGFPPPQIVTERNDSILSITKGLIILTADSTFTDSTEIQWIIGGQPKDTVEVAKGFFRTTVGGDSLNFYAGAAAYKLARDDNALIQEIDGAVLVYRK